VVTDPHPRFYNYSMNDRWIPATDPVHRDRTHEETGGGLAMRLGPYLAGRYPHLYFGVSSTAHSASSIVVWQKDADPPGWPSSNPKKQQLFSETVEQTLEAMERACPLAIVAFFGELDVGSRMEAGRFGAQLARFAHDFRAAISLPRLPFLVIDFPRRPSGFYKTKFTRIVKRALKRVERTIPHSARVPMCCKTNHCTDKEYRCLARRITRILEKEFGYDGSVKEYMRKAE
jgi:hypothetical protein